MLCQQYAKSTQVTLFCARKQLISRSIDQMVAVQEHVEHVLSAVMHVLSHVTRWILIMFWLVSNVRNHAATFLQSVPTIIDVKSYATSTLDHVLQKLKMWNFFVDTLQHLQLVTLWGTMMRLYIFHLSAKSWVNSRTPAATTLAWQPVRTQDWNTLSVTRSVGMCWNVAMSVKIGKWFLILSYSSRHVICDLMVHSFFLSQGVVPV